MVYTLYWGQEEPKGQWTIPLDGVGFPAGFFSFCIMEDSGFSIKFAISSIPYTGFCVCKGYGWPWISGKICDIIHTLVGFEQSIFCSCLDFF